MLKVLQLIETGGPGGAEKVVIDLSSELIKKGVEVQVATLREGYLTEELDRRGIKRHLLESKAGKLDFTLIKSIRNVLKSEKINVLHSHLLDSNLYSSIAGRLNGIPVICSEHGDIHHTIKKSFLLTKLKLISLLAHRILPVSLYTYDSLLLSGVSPKKMEILSNPIDLTPCDPVLHARDRIDIRAELEIPIDAFLWAHVANIRPVKDQVTLIKGFLDSTNISSLDQFLVIVGDGEGRKHLEKEVNKHEQGHRIKFLGHRQDVPNILNASDGFILSSLSEAMPMSILEAIKAKLLVISSYVGGVPEIIREGETGFLFEPGSKDDLAEKIVLALTVGTLKAEMTSNAYHNLKLHADTKVVIQSLIEIYEDATQLKVTSSS